MRVLVVFGGRSGEHEVSVTSARLVTSALAELGHDVVTVGITRSGLWVRADPHAADRVPDDGEPFALTPQPQQRDVDAAFPVLHGPFGEDGSLQGLFELADIPYVGAGIEGSVLCLNKWLQKVYFAQAGLPVVPFVGLMRSDWDRDEAASVGFPCFVKPVHLGSSVGISKVAADGDLDAAIERAFRHDDEILIEAHGFQRELEVGVLGDPPEVSMVGEVVPDGEFYDYRAKYLGDWTEITIPADIPTKVEEQIRFYAETAFSTTRCEGLARVDFFFDPATEALQVNEINSIPGLTPNSMFPRVWEASGKPFAAVVGELLAHALARHERKAALEAARASAHDDEVGG